QHLTNLYAAEHMDVEKFILLDGGIYTTLFWLGQVVLGALVPMALLFHPATNRSCQGINAAAMLVILGGFAQVYIIIIGGQAYPLEMFPGFEVSSTFFDGSVHGYAPSLPEIVLGLGGVATALLIVMLAVRYLPILPASLSDAAVGPANITTKEDE
ncbi:MAG: polysulfide reductase NrfD, partial [Rhodospirillaceae bacterium]|nr:polysulfide reductase NrfD [Rhodospirillaceae bacterium]